MHYVGNKITDFQLSAFKLIQDYDLSWDYCSRASDMNALTKFAFDDEQFLKQQVRVAAITFFTNDNDRSALPKLYAAEWINANTLYVVVIFLSNDYEQK